MVSNAICDYMIFVSMLNGKNNKCFILKIGRINKGNDISIFKIIF